MVITITMPQPSHYVTDGTVLNWYKKEGDPIQEGEPLLEFETIKATQEILAPNTGTVKHILVKEGETVVCDSPLVEIEVDE